MKKSFALLITIVIICLFAYLSISILTNNSLKSNSTTLYYLQTQASFHQQFFKNLILDARLNCPSKITLENELFEINATFTYIVQKENCQNSHAIVDTYIKAKDETFHVRLHERFLKKL